MKLLELEIENFGIFSACPLRFDPGFQLVYGENEAGKTTLLQLIREQLFGGFPQRSAYVLDRTAGEMAASALLELSDGTHIRFRRRKGRKDTFVGQNERSGQPIDQAQLSQMLSNASPELYHNVFAFRLEELSEGEDSLTRANLSEALYGSGLGGLANVQRVQKVLSEERQSLFVPTAKRRVINDLLRRLKASETDLRRSAIKPRDFQQMSKDYAESETKVNHLHDALEKLRRQQAHYRRVSDALTPWLQRAAAQREWDDLQVPENFAPHAAEEFARCRESLDQLDVGLAEIESELELNSDALGNVALRQDIVDREAEIKHLQQQIGKIQGFRHDLPLRRQEAASIRDGVLNTLRHLNPDWGLQQLELFQSTLAQRETFESLRDQWEQLQRRASQLEAQRPALQSDVATAQTKLEQLSQIDAVPQLEDLMQRQAQYQADQEKLAQIGQRMQHVSAEVATVRTKLDSPLGCRVTNAEKLPVPMQATVIEFRERFAHADKELERHQHRLDSARSDVANRRQMLVQLDAEEQIPSKQELRGQRARREEGWQLIRQKYVHGKSDSEAVRRWLSGSDDLLPDVYEAEVAKADRLADALQENAEKVARRDQLLVEIEHADRQVEEAERQHRQAMEERSQLNCQWEELWTSCRFTPLSPDAMLRWLDLHEELLEKLEELSVAEIQSRDVEARIGDFDDELREALPEGVESPSQNLAEARRRAKIAQEAAVERQTYEMQLPRKTEELQRVDHELNDVAKKRDEWTQQWRSILTEAQFPVDWDVNVATKILSAMGEARQEFSRALTLEQRAADMENELAEFKEAVTNLCSATEPDLLDLPADDAALTMNQRLEDARQSERDQASLLQNKAKLEKRLASTRSQRQQVQERLDHLMQAAEAEDESHFHRVAAAAARKHELASKIESLTDQIHSIRGTEDETMFSEALAGADTDSLAAQLRRLSDQIEHAESEYRSASESLGVHRDRLEQLDGTSQALRLQLDLESTRSELASAVDRWAPLVLAEALLKEAIARFENEHQPAVLEEVTRLFRRMTNDRYTGLRRRLDGPLMVHEHDGTLKQPHELSRGTREQLYLAIRLAYVHHYRQNAEPLPLAMDDVLVNFDDQRARETLDVLWEIAESSQIIFLTCHQSMVDLVTSMHPEVEPIHLHAGAAVSSS